MKGTFTCTLSRRFRYRHFNIRQTAISSELHCYEYKLSVAGNVSQHRLFGSGQSQTTFSLSIMNIYSACLKYGTRYQNITRICGATPSVLRIISKWLLLLLWNMDSSIQNRCVPSYVLANILRARSYPVTIDKKECNTKLS